MSGIVEAQWAPKDIELFKELYQEGKATIKEIAALYSIDDGTVTVVAVRLGLQPRRPSKKRDIDTEIAEAKAKLKALEEEKVQQEVRVELDRMGTVTIFGLVCDRSVTTDMEDLRRFVRGGGLGKLRDLTGRTDI